MGTTSVATSTSTVDYHLSSDDYENDSTFQPPGSTPEERAKPSATIGIQQKNNVKELDGGRCFISNLSLSILSLDCAHVVARATCPGDLRKLEIMWNINSAKGFKLNLGSRRNLMHLSPDWHRHFDTGNWAIVPTDRELSKVLTLYTSALDGNTRPPPLRESLGRNNGKLYEYTIVYFPPLRSPFSYLRLPNDPSSESIKIELDRSGISETRKLHVHPYFSIWNANKKFDNFVRSASNGADDLTKEQYHLYVGVKNVVKAWEEYYDRSIAKRSNKRNRDAPSGPGQNNDNTGGGGDTSKRSKPSTRGNSRGPSSSKRSGARPKDKSTHRANNTTTGGAVDSAAGNKEPTTNIPGCDSQDILDGPKVGAPLTPPDTPPVPQVPFDISVVLGQKSDPYDVTQWLEHIRADGSEPVPERVVQWLINEDPRPVHTGKHDVLEWMPFMANRSKLSSNDWATYWSGEALERSICSDDVDHIM